MGESMEFEQIGLIGDLMQGKELTKQLSDHLSSPSSSHVTNEVLIEKIHSIIEKALTMLGQQTKTNSVNMMDSHCSNGSPKSEVMESEFKHKDVSKKRKTMTKWTEQVKVFSGTATEGSLNDGYSWRKYGQKDILGAKFPSTAYGVAAAELLDLGTVFDSSRSNSFAAVAPAEGYYRCTHRNVQGCLATKQVQKSDEDPMIYEITYKGRHTCTQVSHLNKTLPSKTKFVLEENKPHKHQKNQPQEKIVKIQPPQETIISFGSELEVKIENSDNKEDIFPSFSFASPSIGSENEDNNIFSKTMMENNFMESFSPFISPATSESNIFCLSPCHFGSTGLGPSVQTSESDIKEIVSDPTLVSNSPIDLDIFFKDMDFDMEFPINNTSELCYSSPFPS